ncbi:MAG: group II truncated hemoglobin [Hyphomonadaceae bacterium]
MSTSDTGLDVSPYDRIGGREPVRRLAHRFYEIMADRADAAPIRAMHKSDLGPIADSLSEFLMGWMGGPRDWFMREDRPCIMGLHKALPIGPAERDQWLACMRQAMDETIDDAELKSMLDAAFTRMANAMRSS